jgi:hypothetical protein
MHDQAFEEKGKLGILQVDHDNFNDKNFIKSLIHHGANSQSI